MGCCTSYATVLHYIHNPHTAPDEAPGIVSVDVINSTSLNVSWEEIPPMDRNGIITTYEVRYEPLMTFGGTLMPDLVNTSDLYIVIDNLQEFVAYNISVRAYTSVGPGPFSDEELQMTEEDRKSFAYMYLDSLTHTLYLLTFSRSL